MLLASNIRLMLFWLLFGFFLLFTKMNNLITILALERANKNCYKKGLWVITN